MPLSATHGQCRQDCYALKVHQRLPFQPIRCYSLRLPAKDGQTELTWVSFLRTESVTHASTNRARRTVTWLMETGALLEETFCVMHKVCRRYTPVLDTHTCLRTNCRFSQKVMGREFDKIYRVSIITVEDANNSWQRSAAESRSNYRITALCGCVSSDKTVKPTDGYGLWDMDQEINSGE